MPCNENHLDGGIFAPDHFHHVGTIEIRHDDIGQDKIDLAPMPGETMQPFYPAMRDENGIAMPFEHSGDGFADEGFVVY